MADTQNLISHFYLEVEGMSDSTAVELMRDTVAVTVESSLHLPDVATLRITDTALRWIDDQGLEPGKRLKVSAKGNESKTEYPLFDGEIVELEPEFVPSAQLLTIRAFDVLHRLGRGRYVRSFLNVSDSDLVQKIAQEVGLRAEVKGSTTVHPYVFQNNETNLEFLQARAGAIGHLLFAHERTLHFEPAKAEGDPIEMQWAHNLKEFRPRLTTIHQVSEVTVRGWDPKARQEIMGHVKDGNGTPAVGEKRKPGQLAQTAFNLEAPHLTADRPIRTQAEADRLAQAVADRHASRFMEAEGVCIGDSRIVAGTSVKLAALGDRFTGTYLVTAARHVQTPHEGYLTHFTISGQQASTLLGILAPEHRPPPTRALVIGIVTDNQDPDKQGRVKVKYPWLAPDHASDWARVVAPGNGKDRGIEFLPEVNDEVLVGFEQGDVHHPYVLGGLWNGQDAPPGDQGKVVSSGKVQRRVIRSRSGHTVTLDDADGAGGIVVEDRNGNVIKLDSGGNKLEIKVKGDASLECDGNLTLKAQGHVDIQGMGVKVDGGAATVDVKGSMINLN
jgi:phage protein D/phage baseplate assembly protein gpV